MTMFLYEALSLIYEKCYIYKVALPCLEVTSLRAGKGYVTSAPGMSTVWIVVWHLFCLNGSI